MRVFPLRTCSVRRVFGALCISVVLAGCGAGDDDDVAATVSACGTLAAPAPAPGASAPVSSTGAYMCAAGVGVSNLEASATFYKRLGMTEAARLTRTDRQEVVLNSADRRGSQLVLYTFTDGSTRNYRQNPGKIVFYVRDATAFATAFAAAGGTVSSPPRVIDASGTRVGFGRDLDNNLVEIAQLPAASPSAAQTHSYISAFGVGVSNLEAARAFYVNTLDMRVSQFLSITRPTPTGGTTPWYDEYILVSNTGRGSAIVLMTYTDGVARNYTDNPVKMTLRVNNPTTYAQAIAAGGGTVTRAPAPAGEPALGGAVVGYAKDADGNLIEILGAN